MANVGKLAVGVLAAIMLILWFLDKLPWVNIIRFGSKAIDQSLAGQVLDESNGEPPFRCAGSSVGFKIEPQTTD